MVVISDFFDFITFDKSPAHRGTHPPGFFRSSENVDALGLFTIYLDLGAAAFDSRSATAPVMVVEFNADTQGTGNPGITVDGQTIALTAFHRKRVTVNFAAANIVNGVAGFSRRKVKIPHLTGHPVIQRDSQIVFVCDRQQFYLAYHCVLRKELHQFYALPGIKFDCARNKIAAVEIEKVPPRHADIFPVVFVGELK